MGAIDPWAFFAARPYDRGAIPPVDCSCWRLTQPLTGEPLPDHVCVNTMATTVYRGDAPAGARLTPDIAWPVSYIGDPLDGRGCPVPGAPPRQLGFVLREWAQEDPSPTLAAQLAALATHPSAEGLGWSTALSTARAEFRRWTRRHPDVGPDAWVFDADLDDHQRDVLGLQLWRAGVLPTPSLLRHLRALGAAVPQCREALPARGLLVTTLVFVHTGPSDEYGVIYDGNPEVHLAGPSELMTGPLWEQAGAVARRHRDWLRDHFGRHLLADRAVRYRSQAGAFTSSAYQDAGKYDYAREAIRNTAHLAPSRWRDQHERDLAITRHLNAVFRRVAKRRKRAGMDATPPPGWRAEVRAQLNM